MRPMELEDKGWWVQAPEKGGAWWQLIGELDVT